MLIATGSIAVQAVLRKYTIEWGYIWQKEFVSRTSKISSDDISKELDAFVIKRIVVNHHILAAKAHYSLDRWQEKYIYNK